MRGRGTYKSRRELAAMREPGRITALALAAVEQAIEVGVTPLELDRLAERVIREHGAVPNFQLEPGYQHTLCVSLNDVVVHGIPGDRPIAPGDLVTVDCGATIGGFHGDAAITVVVPGGDPQLHAARQRLSDVTRGALWDGIAALASAKQLGEVGAAVEDHVEANSDYGISDDYIGHGIGRAMHEEPPVFNYRTRVVGPAVKPGLCVAIEPIIHAGGTESTTDDDGWTVRSADGSDACQWEHSVAVHAGGIWVLTALDGGAAELAPYGIVPAPIAER
ncbi:type I methionyl aminopeptidase [Agrococcus sp. ARC_14]|uniref:type I methionyl aminopeptidase n=1 Tax=Agrococcus sp. ARC_14 TaxID=2919927 RepID=UPI001F064CDF|nr:type I methionyl aminopeptidase [Agrococcus sp. ARC_14]MCH1884188.1 type I methionyl aminopeptidase [Agrococcus sp. ARC_14]